MLSDTQIKRIRRELSENKTGLDGQITYTRNLTRLMGGSAQAMDNAEKHLVNIYAGKIFEREQLEEL